MSKAKKAGFEERLARLEAITATLEKEELGLEDSLALYKEGVGIAAACRKTLEEAKHTVKIYTEDGLRDFAAADASLDASAYTSADAPNEAD